MFHCDHYRYTPGQAFGKHIDESNEVGPSLITLFTLLIYLSGRSAGGQSSHSDSSAHHSTHSDSASGASKGRKGRQQLVTQPPTGSTTTAVQPLLGGETVFYGEYCQISSVAAVTGCHQSALLAIVHALYDL